MNWIPRTSYEEYVSSLDPYLRDLGAGDKWFENESFAGDSVLVGMVRFPSGQYFAVEKGVDGPRLQLWELVYLPVYGFADAVRTAIALGELAEFWVSVDWNRQTIEVSGKRPSQWLVIHFLGNRVVNITRKIEKGEEVVA